MHGSPPERHPRVLPPPCGRVGAARPAARFPEQPATSPPPFSPKCFNNSFVLNYMPCKAHPLPPREPVRWQRSHPPRVFFPFTFLYYARQADIILIGTHCRDSHAPQQMHVEVHGDAEQSFILQTAMNLLWPCVHRLFLSIPPHICKAEHSIKDL